MGPDTLAYEGTMKRLLAVVVAAAALACPAAAQTFEASNGSKFKVLRVMPGSSVLMVDDGGNVINFLFDCAGMRRVWHAVPSRSVLARIGEIACR